MYGGLNKSELANYGQACGQSGGVVVVWVGLGSGQTDGLGVVGRGPVEHPRGKPRGSQLLS